MTPTRKKTHSPPPRIPLGAALVIIGLMMALTAILLWALAPVDLPQRLALAIVPAYATPVTLPTPMPLATTALEAEAWRGGVFLPETPARGELPSLAAADLAPRLVARAALPNQPTRLSIPRIGLDAPVAAIGVTTVRAGGQTYLQWNVPNAPVVGWHDTSAVLGAGGNTVLNGHHNIYGEVFRHLADLEAGDEIVAYAGETVYRFVVSETLRLPERGETTATRLENARWIEPTADERLTLITCWPYTGNSHRLVVVARPAAETP
ncbi:MAG: sortase [Anaerolineales bacterium]|nr:sortase [Anaerolineales bacterium]MCB8952253.1 sortase [Ardenticatenales bacterium]